MSHNVPEEEEEETDSIAVVTLDQKYFSISFLFSAAAHLEHTFLKKKGKDDSLRSLHVTLRAWTGLWIRHRLSCGDRNAILLACLEKVYTI